VKLRDSTLLQNTWLAVAVLALACLILILGTAAEDRWCADTLCAEVGR
jgi:hypothetical protein